MIRENPNQQDRYFLRKKSRFAIREFYHESGIQCVGTENETEYINFTRYLSEARGFKTVKTARRMADMIREKYGIQICVVDRNGEVVA